MADKQQVVENAMRWRLTDRQSIHEDYHEMMEEKLDGRKTKESGLELRAKEVKMKIIL